MIDKRTLAAVAVVFSNLLAPIQGADLVPPGSATAEYVLGPDDQIRVWALGMEELADKVVRVDSGGFADVPIAGRVRTAGLTVDQLKLQIVERLSKELRKPEVSVNLVEFGSQPVSLVGAVATPGVHQLRGRKNLAEVLALAGGIRPDAGCCIKISRAVKSGEIPLPGSTMTSDGSFFVGTLRLKDFLGAENPTHNIAIRPHDVITVPTAQLVYIIGAVRKPGAFPLHEQENISVLQALSLAEGAGATPSLKNAKVLRVQQGMKGQRAEIAVDLSKVMTGKAEDIAMQPNDILYVPSSNAKKAGLRAVEAAIYATTGVVIWRR